MIQDRITAESTSFRIPAISRKLPELRRNATSVTPDIRSRLIALFTGYNAYVKIIFLETDYRENLQRNKNRKDAVPQAVIEKMLAKLTPPERFEAHEVNWICI